MSVTQFMPSLYTKERMIPSARPRTDKYIQATGIGIERLQYSNEIAEYLNMSSHVIARAVSRTSNIKAHLRRSLNRRHQEGKLEGTKLQDLARAIDNRQGIFIQDEKKVLVVWEISKEIVELRVERFTNLLAKSGLPARKVAADIKNWIEDEYIGIPIAQAIVYNLITHHNWSRNLVHKAGLDMRMYELAVKSMHPEYGYIARDQSLRKLSRMNQSPGILDEKFLLGTFSGKYRTIASIELNSRADTVIQEYYGVSEEHLDEEAMRSLRNRFYYYAAKEDRLYAMNAIRPILPSLDEVSFIDIDDHEPLAVTEDMSAPDVLERILKVMCYDI